MVFPALLVLLAAQNVICFEIRNKSAAAAQPKPMAINSSITATTIPAAVLPSLNLDNAVMIPMVPELGMPMVLVVLLLQIYSLFRRFTVCTVVLELALQKRKPNLRLSSLEINTSEMLLLMSLQQLFSHSLIQVLLLTIDTKPFYFHYVIRVFGCSMFTEREIERISIYLFLIFLNG